MTHPTFSGQTPTLSVLIPFFRDNPIDTLRAVAAIAPHDVEVLAWDDGTNDPELTARLVVLEETWPALRVLTSPRNQGRSAARNALVEHSRAPWILFLDADMRPVDGGFIKRYLDAIRLGRAQVIFGGFSVPATGPRDTVLHRELSRVSDCHDAAHRTEHGPQHVASSNLCVRRDVLQAEPFDAGFQGWGWEDSEWAARVAARYRLLHIDNPAVHLGLENTATLLRRFASSGENYQRFARAHPDFAQGLPLYRHAERLARVPGQELARPLLKLAVRSPLPVPIRILALKLWRASHYADAMPAPERPLELSA